MTSLVFCLSLLPFFWRLFAKGKAKISNIGSLLLSLYFVLGLCGAVGLAVGWIVPIYEDNYWSVLILGICVGMISLAFGNFDSSRLVDLFARFQLRKIPENILILLQIYSIIFFLPHSINAFRGDVNFNRENLSDTMAVLGSYGWMNTLAGVGAQLFVLSLVFSFVRMAPSGYGFRNIGRASILFITSLSYPIYIMAYVGRDGVIFWVMTVLILYIIFYPHLSGMDRARLRRLAYIICLILFVPFASITASRFFGEGQMGVGSLFQYFGGQIQNFSDYSSFGRPLTYGVSSFPMFSSAGCSLLDLDCANWDEIKPAVFKDYLDAGIEPWLFGTFVNDFAGDFGLMGAFGVCAIFSLFVSRVCRGGNAGIRLSLPGFSR